MEYEASIFTAEINVPDVLGPRFIFLGLVLVTLQKILDIRDIGCRRLDDQVKRIPRQEG